ncbi:MAG: hypothetical protein GTO03_03180, partial [Planctomycetales bacterium]|nr:hypothetical protein [Planctomycetales bacterium]
QLAQQSAQGPPTQYDQRISPREQQQRGSREYQTRKRQLDEFVSNYNVAVQQQQKAVWNRPPADSPAGPLPAADPQPGASRAVWVDGQLLLVRRLVGEGSARAVGWTGRPSKTTWRRRCRT